jgi:hypothetical protein
VKHFYLILKSLVTDEMKKILAFVVLIFVTQSRGWFYAERHGHVLVFAFVIAQLVLCIKFISSLHILKLSLVLWFCWKVYAMCIIH